MSEGITDTAFLQKVHPSCCVKDGLWRGQFGSKDIGMEEVTIDQVRDAGPQAVVVVIVRRGWSQDTACTVDP